MPKSTLGRKIKQIRKSKNLTQEQLAEISGVNEKHISKIETGVYFPTYTTLSKILNALGLGIDDIGLDLSTVKPENNPFYIKSIQILKEAVSECEHEYYYGVLKQAQKGIEILKKSFNNQQ